MAGKFLSLEEAAEQLGLSTEKLKELRDSGEVHGYRDGASWKFKSEEIERVAEELKSGGLAGGSSLGDGGLLDDDDDMLISLDHEPDEESDSSILVSEVELGHSEESTSSTIIGRSPEEASPDSDLSLGLADSKLGLETKPSSDVTLVPGSGTGSDVALVTGADSGLGLKDLDDDDELTLQPFVDSNIDLTPTPSDLQLGDGSEVLSGSELNLESPSGGGTGDLSPKTGSSGDLGLGSGILALEDDELALSEDDDDLVLGGSGTGSDVSLSSIDSGINLTAPSDSGLSLEDDEPLDLGGSSISSLELPEDDDDIIALESEAADPDETTQLKQDEEFLLSPSGEFGGEESDSGSQVIALEDSEAFDEDAATMIQAGVSAGAAMNMFQPVDAGAGGYAQPTGPVQQQVVTVPIEVLETPYSIWNVLGLLNVVLVLAVCGMLMTDVVRNIWSWEGASGASTGLMDALLSAFKF